MADTQEVITRIQADQRRFRRVRIEQLGKLFLPTLSQEITCTVVEMSPGDAWVQVGFALSQNEKIVLYADGLGRFEGVIARVDGGDLSLRFTSSPQKRERTAEQLTLFINKGVVDDTTLRRHERIAVAGIVRLVRSDGQLTPCEATDLSVSGLSLKTDLRPPVGEFLLVGPLAARVARHHGAGIGLEFVGLVFSSSEDAKAKLGLG